MKLDFFLEIEHKYGLVEEQLDGFAYWTYFRTELEESIMQIADSGEELYVHPRRTRWQQMKARAGTIAYAILFGKIPKGKHTVLILNAERRIWSGDNYECIYTDRIAFEYPDSVVLERPYFQKHFRPVKTRNLVYTDPMEIKAMVCWYSQGIFHRRRLGEIRRRIYAKIREPIEEICAAYHVNYNINYILDKMVCGYYVHKVKKKEFEKILDRVAPKIILEVNGYNLDCMVVNELAVERCIPTVELQHGATGKAHIAYNYYPGTRVDQFPQYFFAFSKFWLDMAKYPLPADRLKEVGFPHLNEQAAVVRKRIQRSFPYQIIFISQPKIGKKMSEVAVKLNEIMDSRHYQIVYKLHPGEYERWRERYQKLADSDIRVIDDNHTDLYELFAASTYQIGGYGSTATFEGLEFDLQTYIMREGADQEVTWLCRNGLACFFDSADDLYQSISTNANFAKAEIRFWKENALQNMKREIDSIIACN